MLLPDVDRAVCSTYGSNEELVHLLQRTDFVHTRRNLDELAPRHFVERFEALVRVLQVMWSRR